MSLLHRLGLLQKFMILGTIGLMMSALPTYLYVSDSLQSIAAARREAEGAAPAVVLNKVVQLMQVHRACRPAC
ncbi:methyl-accepting chemotaxis sensory transducer [Acidovorax delafieldii 2AN]|uniref:Methyl-accepting chemotaxis sensory transducer n=1 Tax=Acidovorax delafieldii 2AN TaxID=573060 RepID=C5T9Z4_ACIDE|nr:methyl-accepting chemotaxis sensory transducer [Acidovorax delafieldii 2AN]